MKNLFVITLAITLSLFSFSCGNETSSSDEKTTTTTETANTHDDHAGHNHSHEEEPATVKASPLSPFFGIWKYTGSSSTGWFKNDKWIEFKRDMTFAYGQDGKELGTGKWFLENETNFLTIDYDEDKTRNEHWRTQMKSPVLVLIGNTNISKSGEQIKMDKVEERPGMGK